jgi:hypothetical protein
LILLFGKRYALIFNEPSLLALPAIVLAGLVGLKVVVVDNSGIRGRKLWTWAKRKGLFEARSRITLNPVHTKALTQSRALVERLPCSAAFLADFGLAVEVLLIRLLADRLSEYHYIELQLAEALRARGFLPVVCTADHARLRRLLRVSGVQAADEGLLLILPWVTRRVAWLSQVGKAVVFWSCIHFLLIWQRVVARFFPEAPAPVQARYAVALPFSFFTRFRGRRSYDFLIDEDVIKRDEVVFINQFPLGKQFLEMESARGSRFIPLASGWSSALLRQNFSGASFLVSDKVLNRSLDASSLAGAVSDLARMLVIQGILGVLMLRQCRFKHLIYAMNDDPSVSVANLILQRDGVASWYYNLAIGSPYLYDKIGTTVDPYHVLWVGRIVDHLVVNSQAFADSQATHMQVTGVTHVIGNIFSELVASVPVDEAQARLSVYKSEWKHVLAFFDTSYIDDPDSLTTFDDGLSFYQDVLAFARQCTDDYILIKPSKDDAYFIADSQLWSSGRGDEVVAARRALQLLPNVLFLAANADPSDVIAVADMTITNGFSSPTADALAAGKRGFWYDGYDSHHNYPFDVVGLTQHGFSGLLLEVERQLSMSDAEFKAWLLSDPRRLHLLDPYMDQKALTRFRQLLADS